MFGEVDAGALFATLLALPLAHVVAGFSLIVVLVNCVEKAFVLVETSHSSVCGSVFHRRTGGLRYSCVPNPPCSVPVLYGIVR